MEDAGEESRPPAESERKARGTHKQGRSRESSRTSSLPSSRGTDRRRRESSRTLAESSSLRSSRDTEPSTRRNSEGHAEGGRRLQLHQQLQLFRESQKIYQAARQYGRRNRIRFPEASRRFSQSSDDVERFGKMASDQHLRNRRRLQTWKMEHSTSSKTREPKFGLSAQKEPQNTELPRIAKFVYFGEHHPILYCSQSLSPGSCTTRYLVPKSEIFPRGIVGEVGQVKNTMQNVANVGDLCKEEVQDGNSRTFSVIKVNQKDAKIRNSIGLHGHERRFPLRMPIGSPARINIIQTRSSSTTARRINNKPKSAERRQDLQDPHQQKVQSNSGNVRHFPVTLESRHFTPKKQLKNCGSQTDWSLQPSEPFLFIATNQCDLQDGEKVPLREGSETETDEGETEIQISLATPEVLRTGQKDLMLDNHGFLLEDNLRDNPRGDIDGSRDVGDADDECSELIFHGRRSPNSLSLELDTEQNADFHMNELTRLSGNLNDSRDMDVSRLQMNSQSNEENNPSPSLINSTVNTIVANLLKNDKETANKGEPRVSQEFDFDLFPSKPNGDSIMDLYTEFPNSSGEDFQKSISPDDSSAQYDMSSFPDMVLQSKTNSPTTQEFYEDCDLEDASRELFPSFDSLLSVTDNCRSKPEHSVNVGDVDNEAKNKGDGFCLPSLPDVRVTGKKQCVESGV